MTSLFRELVPVPIVLSASSTITSRRASANALAMARPTTPAPTTTTSTRSADIVWEFRAIVDDAPGIEARTRSPLVRYFRRGKMAVLDRPRRHFYRYRRPSPGWAHRRSQAPFRKSRPLPRRCDRRNTRASRGLPRRDYNRRAHRGRENGYHGRNQRAP